MRDGDDGVYHADLAHGPAREHARRQRRGIFARDEQLRLIVQNKLHVQWSPEQIAAWLTVQYPTRPGWHICHETIYQGLYFGGSRGLSRLARARIGDFEGDLIVGHHGRSAIGTLVDRATRYLRLVHVPEQCRSDEFAAVLTAALSDLPHIARLGPRRGDGAP